jgi:diadenosine tetraphosphate (Ap4A) HIT family hydrolase
MDKPILNLGNARVPAQAEQMRELERLGICPFCLEHFEEHHAAPIIAESRYWLVTHNDYPYGGSEAHILLVSRRHIENPVEMSASESSDLMTMFRWVVMHFDIAGGSFFLRFGDMERNGGSIAHLHAHVITGVEDGPDTEPLKVKLAFKKK